jgi:hypothetical protein
MSCLTAFYRIHGGFPAFTLALFTFAALAMSPAPAGAAVLTLTPAFDGEVQDVNRDGTFNSNSTTSLDLQVASFPTFEMRSVLEFSTSAIPVGATIDSVHFVFQTMGAASNPARIVSLTGYYGDGVISNSDATSVGLPLGSYDAVALGVGPQSVALDVTAFNVLRTTGATSIVGLRLQGADTINTTIASTEYSEFAVAPHLVVNYTPIPEPASVALLGLGSLALLARRRARA